MNPADAGSYFQLGKVCRSAERWTEAEAALCKALELDPQNGWARLELGNLLLDQGRLAEAEAELRKVTAVDRNNSWAYCQLGDIYRKQRRLCEAEAALQTSLKLDPQNGCAHIELGVLYADQNRFIQAEVEFETAIALDGSNSGAHYQLGKIYRRQRRWGGAEEALNKALEFEPGNGSVRLEIGTLYLDQDKLAEAEAAFQKAIAFAPRNSWAHFQMGNVYRLQGRWGEAETAFEDALAIDPGNGQAFMGLWAIYGSQGRSAEAEAAARKASAINPGNAWACTGAQERLEPEKAVCDDADRNDHGCAVKSGGAPGRFEPVGANAPFSQSLAQDSPKERMRDQVFCLLPWTQLHIRPDGFFYPCCVWNGPSLGNARSSSLAELWNSPGLKALRLDMMNGRPVAGCEKCYMDERFGTRSARQRINLELGHHSDREGLTAPDGTLSRLTVTLLDVRFSNVCNLRCRTCDLRQSSAWMADARALGLPAEGGPIQKPYDDWDSLWRQLEPLLEEGLEEIVFLGGEPLIMEEHYRILNFLNARKRTDVRLSYVTNLSTLRSQGRDVIDLWSRFSDVRVTASLDGSGRRGEYLRKGLHWEAVVANREEMLRRCPDVEFSISATLSIFNALHLPDFHREWSEVGYINRNAFNLNVLLSPQVYCVRLLPAALKQRVLESYQRHRETFLDVDGNAAREFVAAARFIEEQDCSELLPEFVAMTRRLDELRGEDCREVFPELAALFEAS